MPLLFLVAPWSKVIRGLSVPSQRRTRNGNFLARMAYLYSTEVHRVNSSGWGSRPGKFGDDTMAKDWMSAPALLACLVVALQSVSAERQLLQLFPGGRELPYPSTMYPPLPTDTSTRPTSNNYNH